MSFLRFSFRGISRGGDETWRRRKMNELVITIFFFFSKVVFIHQRINSLYIYIYIYFYKGYGHSLSLDFRNNKKK